MGLSEDDKRWIEEQLERVETRLLTEFHKWASPKDMMDQVRPTHAKEADELKFLDI